MEGSAFYFIGEPTLLKLCLLDFFSFPCGEKAVRVCVTSAPRVSSRATVFLCFAMGGSLCIVNQVCLSQRWVLLGGEDGRRRGERGGGEGRERERKRESPRLDLPAPCFSQRRAVRRAALQPLSGRVFPRLPASPESSPPRSAFKQRCHRPPPAPSTRGVVTPGAGKESSRIHVVVSFCIYVHVCVHASRGAFAWTRQGFSQ